MPVPVPFPQTPPRPSTNNTDGVGEPTLQEGSNDPGRRVPRATGSSEREQVDYCIVRACHCRKCRGKFAICVNCLCATCQQERAQGHPDAQVVHFCRNCECSVCATKVAFCSKGYCNFCDKARTRLLNDDGSGEYGKSSKSRSTKRKAVVLGGLADATGTPDKRIRKGSTISEPRKDTAAAKAIATFDGGFKVPKGTENICAISLLYTNSDTIHFCHVIPRAASPELVTRLEIAWGMKYDSFNVDSSDNLLSLQSTYHGSFDNHEWALLPTDRELLKRLIAFSEETNKTKILKKIYAEEGRRSFTYIFLPFKCFKGTIFRLTDVASKGQNNQISAPYNDVPPLTLHIHPHLVVYNLMEKYSKLSHAEKKDLHNWISKHKPEVLENLSSCEELYDIWMEVEIPDDLMEKINTDANNTGVARPNTFVDQTQELDATTILETYVESVSVDEDQDPGPSTRSELQAHTVNNSLAD